MRNRYLNVEDWTVNEVAQNIPGAGDVLRTNNIDANSPFSLANAAKAAATTSDELLAVMNHRMRRAAQRQAKAAEVAQNADEVVA
jgi:iron-sulfur cluster repair protein YtfE (RIC family)